MMFPVVREREVLFINLKEMFYQSCQSLKYSLREQCGLLPFDISTRKDGSAKLLYKNLNMAVSW